MSSVATAIAGARDAHVSATAPEYGPVSYWGSAKVLIRLSWSRTFSLMLLASIAGLLLLPMLFALLFASRGALSGDPVTFLVSRYDTFMGAAATPLMALLIGTSAFSAEMEDGTLLYLVTTTTPRWWIAAVRVVYAAVLTGTLSAIAVWGTGFLAAGTSDPEGVTTAFTVAVFFGGAAYAALITALALLTRRALVSGLLYVLFWEGLLSATFPAIKYLSVRQWMLSVAASNTEFSDARFTDGPSLTASLISAALLIVLAIYFGGRSLHQPRITRLGT